MKAETKKVSYPGSLALPLSVIDTEDLESGYRKITRDCVSPDIFRFVFKIRK